jgi:hypothetical protein
MCGRKSNAAVSFWGAQAASLFFSAACRKGFDVQQALSLERDVVGKLPTTAG